ncbi:MAG: hypothetical protein QOJ25_2442 [Solirubrobacteraceae bacterium]|jgi:hypothetical protein|nr:hypothetical protein [Solirubrobacteraceae bacterium]
MFLAVRSRLVYIALLAAVAAISVPGVQAATNPPETTHHHKKKGPTKAQKIKAAVAAAERSPDLWATANKCESPSLDDPTADLVGIRAQMPGLGYPATLSMMFSVSYWNRTDNMFEPANSSQNVSLGMGTRGVHQGGVDFHFSPPASDAPPFVVRGTVTFEWTIAGKVVGKVTRNTGHGYAGVGFSVPAGYSAGTCTLTVPPGG